MALQSQQPIITIAGRMLQEILELIPCLMRLKKQFLRQFQWLLRL